jgi:MoxR-like ATPase
MKLSRARAALAGRDYVTPEDVKAVAMPALAHRIVLRTELWVRRITPEEVVAELIDAVPTPVADDLPQP